MPSSIGTSCRQALLALASSQLGQVGLPAGPRARTCGQRAVRFWFLAQRGQPAASSQRGSTWRTLRAAMACAVVDIGAGHPRASVQTLVAAGDFLLAFTRLTLRPVNFSQRWTITSQ